MRPTRTRPIPMMMEEIERLLERVDIRSLSIPAVCRKWMEAPYL